ncbi:zinc finger BED domain-containing protein RICESLEEPER 2-like protein [Tanacetum coccineum]
MSRPSTTCLEMHAIYSMMLDAQKINLLARLMIYEITDTGDAHPMNIDEESDDSVEEIGNPTHSEGVENPDKPDQPLQCRCNKCSKIYSAESSSGTGNLKSHIKKCLKSTTRDIGQYMISSNKGVLDTRNAKFSQDKFRELLVHAVVRHDLLFSFTEYEGVGYVFKYLEPDATNITRNTTKVDMLKLHGVESKRLRDELLSCPSRICLTSDAWTSIVTDNCEKDLTQDVPTRWNSTYRMLSSALYYRHALVHLSMSDSNYQSCPSADEWDRVEKICDFLKVFYEATLAFSGSLYPTSNLYLPMVFLIHLKLVKELESLDEYMRKIANHMWLKFNKYWSDFNLLLAVAVVFDPHYKYSFLRFSYAKLYGKDLPQLKKEFDLFDKTETSGSTEQQRELDFYLKEPRAATTSSICVLDFWKPQCSKDTTFSLEEPTRALDYKTIFYFNKLASSMGLKSKYTKASDDGAGGSKDASLLNPCKQSLRSPFTRRIIEFPAPKHLMPTNLKICGGSTGPDDHISRAAGGWFGRLPNGCIDNWELHERFIERFTLRKKCFKDPTEIQKIIQKANESLLAFKERWMNETSYILDGPE